MRGSVRIALAALLLSALWACSPDSGFGELRVCVTGWPEGSDRLELTASSAEGELRGQNLALDAASVPPSCATLEPIEEGSWRVAVRAWSADTLLGEALAEEVRVRSERTAEATLAVEAPPVCEIDDCPGGNSCELAYCALDGSCALLEIPEARCQPPTPCESLGCQNSGACIERDGAASCSCPRGYGGALCEVCIGGPDLGDADADGRADLCVPLEAEAPATPAPTFVVDTEVDSLDADLRDGICADDEGRCSLRAALAEVNEADARAPEQRIELPAGTFVLTLAAPMQLAAPVWIRGAGAGQSVIDAGDQPGFLRIRRRVSLRLSDLSVRGASGAGAVTCENCRSLVVEDSLFENNHVERELGGAAIRVEEGDPGVQLELRRSTFRNNIADHADGGGAVAIEASGESNHVRIEDCVFEDNANETFAQLGGGALLVLLNDLEKGALALHIERSHFVRNRTSADGGAIRLRGNFEGVHMDAAIVGSSFEQNFAVGDGGAIGIEPVNGATVGLDLAATSLIRNTGAAGGGLSLGGSGGGSRAWIGNCTFGENVATLLGGAAFLTNSREGLAPNRYELRASTFVGNSSGGHGGGVMLGRDQLEEPAIAQMRNCVFAENEATMGSHDLFVTVAELTSHGGNFVAGPIFGDHRFAEVTGHLSDLVGREDALLDPKLEDLFTDPSGVAWYLPAADSPLIDLAQPDQTLLGDQRGMPRRVDGDNDGLALADAGAVERPCEPSPDDDDSDGDGLSDGCDPCPFDADNGSCGRRDHCGPWDFGPDDDGNGVPASCDRCPGQPALDDDADGWPDGCDCRPGDGADHPGASERCDNRDNDCDGELNEGLAHCFVVSVNRDSADAVPGDGICADSRGGCSLRAAVMEASATQGDASIWLPAGRFVLPPGGALTLEGTVHLRGAGAARTAIDGEGRTRLFSIAAGARVVLEDLALVRGSAGRGSALQAAGSLTLRGVRVEDNQSGDGAAVELAPAEDDAELEVSRCAFIHNRGATLRIVGGGATLRHSTFAANDAGAVILAGDTTASAAHLTVVRNGGGMQLEDEATLALVNSLVAENDGPALAGAAGLQDDGGNLIDASEAGLSPLLDEGDGLPFALPLAGSPALDGAVGNVIGPTDQRGFLRPLDGDADGTAHSDIGAVERRP